MLSYTRVHYIIPHYVLFYYTMLCYVLGMRATSDP